MAGVYRKFEVGTWGDPYILELKPDEKLFFIYLLTNQSTTQIGIYEFNVSMALFQLKISAKRMKEIMAKFNNDRKILFDRNTSEILLVNWPRHNFSKSPKVYKHIKDNFKATKSKILKKVLLSIYYNNELVPLQNIKSDFDSYFTADQAKDYTNKYLKPMSKAEIEEEIAKNEAMAAAAQQVRANTSRKTKQERDWDDRMKINHDRLRNGTHKQYGEYVILTDKEYAGLVEKYGKQVADRYIENVDYYLRNRTTEAERWGRYIDFAGTVRTFIRRDEEKGININGSANGHANGADGKVAAIAGTDLSGVFDS